MKTKDFPLDFAESLWNTKAIRALCRIVFSKVSVPLPHQTTICTEFSYLLDEYATNDIPLQSG